MVHNEEVDKDFIDIEGIPYPLRAFSKSTLLLIKIPFLRRLFDSRLGNLVQYNATPMVIPPSYKDASAAFTVKPVLNFSIVTPSFNQEKYVEATIQSVLSQGYPNLEYVVKDGGSTDDSIPIIERYRKQLKRVDVSRDSGQANAINVGFSYISGDIMGYINSDDIYLPGTFHYVANFFADNQDIDVVYGHRIMINENGHEIGRWIVPPHSEEVLRCNDYIPQETLFWRTRIWEKVGGLIDESYEYALDWELLLRFQKARAKFHRLPRFLGGFRVHKSQKTTAWDAIGKKEVARLRKQCYGREVTKGEMMQKTLVYQLHALLLSEAYRYRILQY